MREIEEELGRQALEAAMGELHRLETALDRAREREREGRRFAAGSALSGEPADRVTGLALEGSAQRHQAALVPWREAAAEEAGERREELLERRVRMREAETLVSEAEAREAADRDRRAQIHLDDWFGARLYREDRDLGTNGAEPALPGLLRPCWAEPDHGPALDPKREAGHSSAEFRCS